MHAVADTGPINYLVLIEQISILPRLFEVVFVPDGVAAELSRPKTPQTVRDWIAVPPPWLNVRPHKSASDSGLDTLDEGERDAILLALDLDAGLILMDDRAGVAMARDRGLTVIGTLGVLDLAARRGWLDLTDAFAWLRKTSFRCRSDLLEAILAEHEARP